MKTQKTPNSRRNPEKRKWRDIKSRDIILLQSQSYGFSSSCVPIQELDHKKKSECQRIDAFRLRCWRRLLRVPCTVRSNQSILKENQLSIFIGRTELKLQYFGHLMQRANSLEKTLMLGKTEGKRG